jgi:serine/threonine protein kinase
MIEQGKQLAKPSADRASPVPANLPEDPLSIGELIKTRYRVVSRFATGPTGSVYRARDVETGAEVTLKLLPDSPGLDETLVRRLRDELSVTRGVAQIWPSVAVVHDCNRTADGRAFMVLEPLDGRSLADLIRQDGPLPVERALRLAFQIAKGLDAVHRVALVHGALNAEHVLVVAEETVKLIGFEVGRIRAAGHRSRPPDPAAPTGARRSPPATQADGLTPSADIQAVGFVLLQMLTGTRPGSQGAAAASGSALEVERSLEVPSAVKQIAMQALVRFPEPRFRDMDSLANALWVELAPTISAVSRPAMWRTCASNRLRAWVRRLARLQRPRLRWRAAAVGALVAAIIGLGAWVTRSRPTGPSPVAPVIHAVPDPQSAPAAAPVVPEPVPTERSMDVAVEPPPAPQPARPPALTLAAPPTPERQVPGTTPPATGDDAKPKPRATPPRPDSPAVRTTPPATSESTQARPRAPARPAPASSPPRQEPDAPDPSAIIDWLLNEHPLRR